MFNVLIVRKGDMFSLFRNYLGVSRKSHPRFVNVENFPARHVRIEAVTHALAQVDGEIMGPAPVDISIRSKVLPVLVSE